MATKNGQAVAPVNISGHLPADMDLDYLMQDAGAGVSNMGAGDVGIPYVSVLQTNSPQVNPGHAKYVPGAQAGMFYNSATGEVYGNQIKVVSCAHERKLVEWADRDLGPGGYIGEYDINSDILSQCKPNAKGKPALPNTNMIVETAYQYCLLENPNTGRWEQVVLPLKSTMLKKNRRWNNLITGAVIPGTTVSAPRWLFPYTLKTAIEAKGNNSWYNIDVEREPSAVGKDVYDEGKAFHQMFERGQVNRAPEQSDSDDETPAAGGPVDPNNPTGAMTEHDEIPF